MLLGLWIAFFPKTLEPLFAFKKLIVSGNKVVADKKKSPLYDEENSRKLMGLWIKNQTSPNEKVFIAGFSSQAQVYSERISPSVYFNASQTIFAKKRLYSDLLMNKPAVLVIPLFESYPVMVDKDVRHFISDLVQSDYSLDTSIYNYNVFKLKNTSYQ